MTLKATDVFVPGSYPQHTYVEREAQRFEATLRDALDTPGQVVSLSGPSKSGKTVLVERVVGRDLLVPISGASIRRPEEVWQRALDWMDVPNSSSGTQKIGGSVGVEVSGKGSVGLPLVAKGEAGPEDSWVADLSTIAAQFYVDWDGGIFRYQGACDFQRALYLLFRESWRARVCEKCETKFIARRVAQKYCSTECSGNMQRELKRKWWAEHGETWRRRRKKSKRNGKGGHNGTRKTR